jgi:hypothetical protein
VFQRPNFIRKKKKKEREKEYDKEKRKKRKREDAETEKLHQKLEKIDNVVTTCVQTGNATVTNGVIPGPTVNETKGQVQDHTIQQGIHGQFIKSDPTQLHDFLSHPLQHAAFKKKKKKKEKEEVDVRYLIGHYHTQPVRSLDGFAYSETDGCVEIWIREVKKGIRTKRGRCVGTINRNGEETICGKVFARVPNCRRHCRLVHKVGACGLGSPLQQSPRLPILPASGSRDASDMSVRMDESDENELNLVAAFERWK